MSRQLSDIKTNGYTFYQQLNPIHRSEWDLKGSIASLERPCESLAEFVFSGWEMNDSEKAYWLEALKDYEK